MSNAIRASFSLDLPIQTEGLHALFTALFTQTCGYPGTETATIIGEEFSTGANGEQIYAHDYIEGSVDLHDPAVLRRIVRYTVPEAQLRIPLLWQRQDDQHYEGYLRKYADILLLILEMEEEALYASIDVEPPADDPVYQETVGGYIALIASMVPALDPHIGYMGYELDVEFRTVAATPVTWGVYLSNRFLRFWSAEERASVLSNPRDHTEIPGYGSLLFFHPLHLYTTQDQRQQQCKSLIEKYAAHLPKVV